MLTNSTLNNKDFFGNSIVYRTKDEWGDIFVIDKNLSRVLAFDPIYEQSSINLLKPHVPVHEYTQIMLLVLAFINPSHITILGLGGGSLIHCLHYLLPQCTVLSIELRKKVHEVAVNFFLLPIHPNLQTIISDAKWAINRCKDKSTQIIFADMYQSYGMHPLQIQKRFIYECQRVLDDKGWLVINYLQLPQLSSGFMQLLQHYFAKIFVCPAFSGNYILFACKSRAEPNHRQQITVSKIEQQLNLRLIHLYKRLKPITMLRSHRNLKRGS